MTLVTRDSQTAERTIVFHRIFGLPWGDYRPRNSLRDDPTAVRVIVGQPTIDYSSHHSGNSTRPVRPVTTLPSSAFSRLKALFRLVRPQNCTRRRQGARHPQTKYRRCPPATEAYCDRDLTQGSKFLAFCATRTPSARPSRRRTMATSH